MLSAGFERAVPTNERPHTHAVDREATGIGSCVLFGVQITNTACSSCDFAVHSIERVQFTEKTKCKNVVVICVCGISGTLIAQLM
jgi:hypothetical protein